MEYEIPDVVMDIIKNDHTDYESVCKEVKESLNNALFIKTDFEKYKWMFINYDIITEKYSIDPRKEEFTPLFNYKPSSNYKTVNLTKNIKYIPYVISSMTYYFNSMTNIFFIHVPMKLNMSYKYLNNVTGIIACFQDSETINPTDIFLLNFAKGTNVRYFLASFNDSADNNELRIIKTSIVLGENSTSPLLDFEYSTMGRVLMSTKVDYKNKSVMYKVDSIIEKPN